MALTDDFRNLREEVRKQNDLGEAYRAEINVLHEQVNGERGLSAALSDLAAKVEAGQLEVKANEKQRRTEHRADRRIWWSIAAGIVSMLVAALIGIVFA